VSKSSCGRASLLEGGSTSFMVPSFENHSN
jgi:hypothetical protein